MRDKPKFDFLRTLTGLLGGVVALVFLVALLLMGVALWPESGQQVTIMKGEEVKVETFLRQFEDESGVEGGLLSASLTQQELNAYLHQYSDMDQNKILAVITKKNAVTLMAYEPFGPVHLMTLITVEPSKDPEMPFHLVEFQVGHLEMPLKWAETWFERLADNFRLDLPEDLVSRVQLAQADVIEVTLQPTAVDQP